MKNLEGATFEEKRDIVNKLDIRVCPSEDLKTMQIKCGLKLMVEGDKKGPVSEDGCRIVVFGLPNPHFEAKLPCFLEGVTL